MTKILLVGTNGKMSGEIAKWIENHSSYQLVGCLSYKDSEVPPKQQDTIVYNNLDEIKLDCYTIVDFSNQAYTLRLLQEIPGRPVKLIIGTSGLTDQHFGELQKISRSIPVFYAQNFSVGLSMLYKFIDVINRSKLANWDYRIHDFHHKNKVDKPSATAINIADRLKCLDHDMTNISCTRLGDGVSEHTIFMHGVKERIDITHRVIDRQAFLPTIFEAVELLETKSFGLFGMENL